MPKLSERRHPLYNDNIDKWMLYRDAVKGGGDFINSENLFAHKLEDSDDYEERLDRVYYLNFCEALPSIFNAYIFKENIERKVDKVLEEFRNNTDGRGTNISDFVARVGFFSKVYGVMHVLVDMPSIPGKSKVTRRFVKDNKIYPYCSLVYPYQMIDWSVDGNGRLRWVVIESTYYRDEDPYKEREVEKHYKLITRDEWRVEDENGNLVKFEDGGPSKGENKLGIVPIATLYHKDLDDDRVGESSLKDIVYINRAILNWCSLIDEQIERNTFSQLVVPDRGALAQESEIGEDPLSAIGTSIAWTADGDSRWPPQFISPDSSNIQVIWRLVVDHIKEIFRLGGLLGTSEDIYVAGSGRSRQMGFLSVNSALAETAAKYQKFENEISELAYMQLGEDISKYEYVKYPDSFDISSLDEEINAYFRIMEKNFSSTLNKTIMKNISRRAVPLAPNSIRSQIEKEIDLHSGIISAGDSDMDRTPEQEAGGQGNPNINNIQNTFRTREEFERESSGHRKIE